MATANFDLEGFKEEVAADPEKAQEVAQFLQDSQQPAAAAEQPSFTQPQGQAQSEMGSMSVSESVSGIPVRNAAADAQASQAIGNVGSEVGRADAARAQAATDRGSAIEAGRVATEEQAKADAEHKKMRAPYDEAIAKANEDYALAVEQSKLRRVQNMQRIDLMESKANELASMNPQGSWAQTDPLGKILVALGAGVGEIGGAVDGTHTNTFLQVFNQGLDRDLALQKLRIAKGQDDFANQNLLLNQFIKAGASVDEAAEMAKLSAITAAKTRIEVLDKHVTNQDLKAKAQANIQALAEQQAELSEKIAKSYAGQAVREKQGLAQLYLNRANAMASSQAAERRVSAKGASLSNDPEVQLTKAITGSRMPAGVRRASLNLTNIESAKDQYARYVGKEDEMTGTQVAQLASEVASIASAGGQGDAATRKELRPETIRAKIAEIEQKYGNSPQPAHLGEFVKLYMNYIEDLEKSHRGIVHKWEREAASPFITKLSPEGRERQEALHPHIFDYADTQKQEKK